MGNWAELLSKHLPKRSDACRWLLDELGCVPETVKELLLSSDEAVREAAGLVMSAALRQSMATAGGAGGRDGVEDAYLAAYAAAVEQEEHGEEGLEVGEHGDGLSAEGFVAVGHGNVDTERKDDARAVQNMVRHVL